MKRYRFSMYLNMQIGVLVTIDKYYINILLPFVTIHIARSKHAKGYNFFDVLSSHV